MIRETPLYSAYLIFLVLTLGWMPGYLFFNLGCPAKYWNKSRSHFNPYSALYQPKNFWQIVISDLALIFYLAVFGWIIYTFGFATWLYFYLPPYLVFNATLVLITFLLHTDVYLPHLDEKEWDWVRGALCTVDRSFGILNYFHHRIKDTHVAHHLFSSMPFYHAQEATEQIKKVLDKFYMKDETPVVSAQWRAFRNQKFIEDESHIAFYKRDS